MWSDTINIYLIILFINKKLMHSLHGFMPYNLSSLMMDLFWKMCKIIEISYPTDLATWSTSKLVVQDVLIFPGAGAAICKFYGTCIWCNSLPAIFTCTKQL